jgi:hypothetical protein
MRRAAGAHAWDSAGEVRTLLSTSWRMLRPLLGSHGKKGLRAKAAS